MTVTGTPLTGTLDRSHNRIDPTFSLGMKAANSDDFTKNLHSAISRVLDLDGLVSN